MTFAIPSKQLFAADGDLDTTFGEGGKVVTDFGCVSDAVLNDLAITRDQKIVAVGSCHMGSFMGTAGARYNDAVIARYLPNGQPDTSFDGDGALLVEFGTPEQYFRDEFSAVAALSDGRILVGGTILAYGSVPQQAFYVIACYHSDGSPDRTFGVDGSVKAGRDEQKFLLGMLMLTDGSFLVSWSAPAHVGLTKYNAEGTLDREFGSDGTVALEYSVRSLARQGDEILAAASSYLYRLHPNGALDVTFGDGGRVDVRESVFDIKDFVVQADGKIVVTGLQKTVRLNADGSADAEIDQAGTAVAVDRNNRVIVTDGYTPGPIPPTDDDFFVHRLTPLLEFDGEFGEGGSVRTDFEGQTYWPSVIAIQSDDKIVVGGWGEDLPRDQINEPRDHEEYRFALARYENSSVARLPFYPSKELLYNKDSRLINRLKVNPSLLDSAVMNKDGGSAAKKDSRQPTKKSYFRWLK